MKVATSRRILGTLGLVPESTGHVSTRILNTTGQPNAKGGRGR